MNEPKPQVAELSVEVSAEELAARARGGDRGAFDELVARCRPRLVAFLAQRLASAVDAEDVAQETFLRAYDHLASYDPARPFATWLFTIGKNVAANHRTAQARREARHERAAGRATDGAPDSSDVWRRAAKVLSPDAYRALWLRYAHDLNVREIAAEMQRSTVAIKVMLFRARRRLLQEVR